MGGQRLDPVRPLFGFLALFSGIALILHILTEVSLPLGLAATSLAVLAALLLATRRSSAGQRARYARILADAAVAGVIATLAYDGAKVLLSQVDPSPYNPFEAIRVFGGLLLGPDASPSAILIAGGTFHLLNGTCFGIAYAFLFGAAALRSRRLALLTGIGWGLFLETFQLTLYPGWLDIRLYQEFATISALSHVVYGGTLGMLVRTFFRRRGDGWRAARDTARSAEGGAG